MSHIGSEVSSYDGVPGGVVFLVEFFLDEGGNILSKANTFSMLNFSKAWLAQSMASCYISSDMSAFLTTAFLSAILFI